MTKKSDKKQLKGTIDLIKVVTKTYTQYKVGVNEFGLTVTKMEFELLCDKFGAVLQDTKEVNGTLWYYYY